MARSSTFASTTSTWAARRCSGWGSFRRRRRIMVTRFEVEKREVVLGGKAFGDAGAYEKVVGTLRFAVDAAHPLHRQITDIALAPTNAERRVEFAADFYVLKPVDPAKGSRRLLL